MPTPDGHPPYAHHHHHKAPAYNMPNEDLRGYGDIIVPLVPQDGLLPDVSVEAESGTDLVEKPYPRRRFASPWPQLRGAVLLLFRWWF